MDMISSAGATSSMPTSGFPDDDWKAAFQGLKVLITGHTGFKGSWLTAWLSLLGARLYGLALPPDGPSLFASARVEERIEGVFGDIRDAQVVNSVFAKVRPELVFHLAAQSLVRRGYRNPVATFDTNVMGTVNILEAVRQSPSVGAVVVVTSDKCYENDESGHALRETDPLGGREPYSASKACAELVTSAYRSSFFAMPESPAIATARAGNVMGGGDWSEDRLIPDIARAIIGGKQVVIRNPHAVRPWQHVLEPLRGYLTLGQRLLSLEPQYAGAWNFGPSQESVVSVEDLVRMFIDVWGDGSFRVAPADSLAPEAVTLRLDSTKARDLLGYQPRINLPMAVDMTVSWYSKQARSSEVAAELTDSQITGYMDLPSK